jgi:hypothetical protein
MSGRIGIDPSLPGRRVLGSAGKALLIRGHIMFAPQEEDKEVTNGSAYMKTNA